MQASVVPVGGRVKPAPSLSRSAGALFFDLTFGPTMRGAQGTVQELRELSGSRFQEATVQASSVPVGSGSSQLHLFPDPQVPCFSLSPSGPRCEGSGLSWWLLFNGGRVFVNLFCLNYSYVLVTLIRVFVKANMLI